MRHRGCAPDPVNGPGDLPDGGPDSGFLLRSFIAFPGPRTPADGAGGFSGLPIIPLGAVTLDPWDPLVFNTLMFLAMTSCRGEPDVAERPECFDPGAPYTAERCSFASPQHCASVQAVLGPPLRADVAIDVDPFATCDAVAVSISAAGFRAPGTAWWRPRSRLR